MAIIGIVAISENYAIGKDGKLPWHYSADLKFFKETTTGNAVVMGANTWRSIGRPLPNRLNIVLSRSGNFETPPEVTRLDSKQALLEFAKDYDKNIYIIGGAKTYADFADVIERWVVTFVPEETADADTFIPQDFLDEFRQIGNYDLGEGLLVKILQRN